MQDVQVTQAQFEALTRRLERSEKRFRLCGGLALATVVGSLTLSTLLPAVAQETGGVPGLGGRVSALESAVASLKTQFASLQQTPGPQGPAGPAGATGATGAQGPAGPAGAPADMSRVTALEAKTAPLSVSGDNLFITGKNVSIVDGSGSTASYSGLGNLTVGYNALRITKGAVNDRTGSHNLIVGDLNNYNRFGCFVAGLNNTANGLYASIGGGASNTVSGTYASISGGSGNTASGTVSSISGGQFNTASGLVASISGGSGNTASGGASSVSGGLGNTAANNYSWTAGGAFTNP